MEPVDPKGLTKDAPVGPHERLTDDGPRAAAPAERLPAVVGDRYAIRGILGQGAMGAVFRAHDRTLGRDVAIKVVRGATGDASDRRARLTREAQLLAAVRHPGIVGVHDVGELSGSPYVVFELVEGARPLDRAWETLPLERRVALLRDAARALGHAHARGVIHRDVKPENILIDAEGRVRVADFGLAIAGGVERLTQSGTCLGTPLYMSPEQFAGGRSPVGPPADVWSLGVCLYEALTGTHPFQAEHLVGLMQQIGQGKYPPPEGAPAPLRDVVQRSLVVDPAARLQDGEAFAAALDGWLDPRRSGAAGAPAVGPAGQAALIVVGGLLALALGAALTRRSPSPESPAPVAPAPAAPAGPPAWFAALPASTRALLPADVYPTDVEGEYLHGRSQATLVLVPGGAYVLGPAVDWVEMNPLFNDRGVVAEAAHVTTLEPLFIGRREVTTREFAAFVEATGHRTASEDGYQVTLVNQQTGQGLTIHDGSPAWRLRRGQPVDQRLPVTCIADQDAEAYCRWAGLRLPTNDEWEAAARGPPVNGAAPRFPWGDALPTRASPRANLKDARFFEATGQVQREFPGMERLDDGSPWVAEPGAFPDGAAPCGALDLVGNVAEWVEAQPAVSTYRGGSFITSIDTSYPQRRQGQARDLKVGGEHIGFRVALSAAAPPPGEVGR